MKKIGSILFGLLLVFSLSAAAEELSGQQILDQLSFDTILSGSGVAELDMITENAKGVQRKYSIKVFLKSDQDGDRQFLEYLSPADVRGTKFLSLGEGQMWLYLPAMGRERRIAGHMVGDSFMGTDFTFDEIGGGFVKDDQYTALRLEDRQEQGLDCYFLDLTASDPGALYEKTRMWVWKEELVPLKVEFYDGEGNLKKTLELSDFKEVSNERIPHSVIMADNVKGTRTLLQITQISEEDVSDEIFSLRYLRR